MQQDQIPPAAVAAVPKKRPCDDDQIPPAAVAAVPKERRCDDLPVFGEITPEMKAMRDKATAEILAHDRELGIGAFYRKPVNGDEELSPSGSYDGAARADFQPVGPDYDIPGKEEEEESESDASLWAIRRKMSEMYEDDEEEEQEQQMDPSLVSPITKAKKRDLPPEWRGRPLIPPGMPPMIPPKKVAKVQEPARCDDDQIPPAAVAAVPKKRPCDDDPGEMPDTGAARADFQRFGPDADPLIPDTLDLPQRDGPSG